MCLNRRRVRYGLFRPCGWRIAELSRQVKGAEPEAAAATRVWVEQVLVELTAAFRASRRHVQRKIIVGERVVSIQGLVWSVAAGAVLAIALSAPSRADQQEISAQKLLSSWQEGDPGMRRVAEVIASAFASGSHGVLNERQTRLLRSARNQGPRDHDRVRRVCSGPSADGR